jgi:hypothetical protein
LLGNLPPAPCAATCRLLVLCLKRAHAHASVLASVILSATCTVLGGPVQGQH